MNTFSVTELRQKTTTVINAALTHGYVYIIQNSKPKVAVVDSAHLAALQEAYEDYLDHLEAQRVLALNEPTITLEELEQEYAKLHPKTK